MPICFLFYKYYYEAKQQAKDLILSRKESASSSLRQDREAELQDKFFELDHSLSLNFETAIQIAKATQ